MLEGYYGSRGFQKISRRALEKLQYLSWIYLYPYPTIIHYFSAF
jgi:hypothetical protein